MRLLFVALLGLGSAARSSIMKRISVAHKTSIARSDYHKILIYLYTVIIVRGHAARPMIAARISILSSLHNGYDDLKILIRFVSRCLSNADGEQTTLECTFGVSRLS